MRVIWIDSDNTFELQSLRNTIFNEIDDTANVHLTLQEEDGTPVTGDSWPKTLQSVGNGRYLYTLGTSVEITAETPYIAHMSVVGSRGEKAEWSLPCVAKVRDA